MERLPDKISSAFIRFEPRCLQNAIAYVQIENASNWMRKERPNEIQENEKR